jgi:hypothetical protein
VMDAQVVAFAGGGHIVGQGAHEGKASTFE